MTTFDKYATTQANIKLPPVSPGRSNTDVDFTMGQPTSGRSKGTVSEFSVGVRPYDLSGNLNFLATRFHDIPTEIDGSLFLPDAVGRLLHPGWEHPYSHVDPRILEEDIRNQGDVVAPLFADTPEDRALQYLWWFNPMLLDLEGVDDGSFRFLAGRSGPLSNIWVLGNEDDKNRVRRVLQENFTAQEQKQMEDLIIRIAYSSDALGGAGGLYRHNFFNKGGHLIEIPYSVLTIQDLKRGSSAHRGAFPRGFGSRKNRGSARGVVNDDFNDSTLTHELVHFLRANDDKRGHGAHPRVHIGIGHGMVDRDEEEKRTAFEEIARTRSGLPFDSASYYKFVDPDLYPPPDIFPARPTEDNLVEAHIARTLDKQLLEGIKLPKAHPFPNHTSEELRRALESWKGNQGPLTFPTELVKRFPELGVFHPLYESPGKYRETLQKFFKGKKGKSAILAVESKYPKSEIARVKIPDKYWKDLDGGLKNPEAIDSYFAQRVQKDGKEYIQRTHIFDPTANASKSADRARRKLASSTPGKLIEYRDGVPFEVENPLGNSVEAIPSRRRTSGIGRTRRGGF